MVSSAMPLEGRLSSVPPEQWKDILEDFGVSMTRTSDTSAGACTITSLLGMPDMAGHFAGVSAVPTASAPAAAVEAAAVRARQRTGAQRRRGQQRPQRQCLEPEPHEEDSRPLEDLLRDLGETTGGSQPSKGKRKTKAGVLPASLPSQRREEGAEEVSQPQETEPTQEAEADKVEVAIDVSEHSAVDALLEAHEATELEASEELWHTVSSRLVKRAGRQCHRRSEASASASDRPNQVRSVERAAAEASLTDEAADPPNEQLATRGVTLEEADCCLEEAAEEASSRRRSLSAGAGGQVYSRRPSVATWLCRPFRRLRDLEEPAVEERADDLLCVRESPPAPSASSAEPLAWAGGSWRVQPSVGTWLVPSPAASPAWSSGRDVHAESSFFPATPDFTPPGSPRSPALQAAQPAQGVVLVPVPVHLLGEVQRIISTGGMSAACSPAS
jgi:hypothetical protein